MARASQRQRAKVEPPASGLCRCGKLPAGPFKTPFNLRLARWVLGASGQKSPASELSLVVSLACEALKSLFFFLKSCGSVNARPVGF